MLLGEASQETGMLGSYPKAKQNIINTVRVWLSPMGWVSSEGVRIEKKKAVRENDSLTPARAEAGAASCRSSLLV